MLMGFTWCIPIKLKKAADVARAYMQHIYSVLGGSTKILTDNGTEFKNEVFRVWFQMNRSKFKDLIMLKMMFLQRHNPWGKTKTVTIII